MVLRYFQAQAGTANGTSLSPHRLFKRFGLKAQITTVAALGIAGLLVYSLLSQLGTMAGDGFQRIANEAREERELIVALHSEILQLRRIERDFLLLRQDSYWKKHKILAKDISERIAAFGKRVEESQKSGLLPETADLTILVSDIIDMNARLDSYALQFVSVASQYNNVGLDDRYGLKKLLRDDTDALGDALKATRDPTLGRLFIELHMIERDLVRLIGEPLGERNFKSEIGQIGEILATRLDKAAMPTSDRANAKEALQAYVKHFGWLADRAKVLAPETRKLEDMAVRLEQEFKKILGQVESHFIAATASLDDNQNRTAELLRFTLIGIMLLVGGTSYLAGRSLTGLISGIEGSMEQLARGKRDVSVEGLERTDAIGRMASALEVFRQQLAEAEQTREEQERFKRQAAEEQAAIFESSTFGIAFIKDRIMVRANYRLEELLGYEQGELCGQPTECWYLDEESWRSVGESYRELQHGQTHRRVIQLRRKDGSLFWAKLNGAALSSDLSRGSVWTVEDITAEYEASEATLLAKEAAEEAEGKLRDSYAELEAANQRLLELDKLKSDFLSSVSHELRTPLTSIRGFASLIDREFSRSFALLASEDGALQKKSQRISDNLAIILKESERLTRLINDVLDLSKIEAGRIEWRNELICAEKMVMDSLNAAQGMFDLKPAVALHFEIQENLPNIAGDTDRLQQVLVNLLNNAVKFTEQGKVTARAFLNQEHMIQIDVQDTGVGFSPEDAEAIFDKFQQSNKGDTLTSKPQGTGLGLTITREIITWHGGRIWARSELGKGSVFSLVLPPAKSNSSAELASGEAPAKDLLQENHLDRHCILEMPKVLVVDDDANVRDYLKQLLLEQGCNVLTATDGQSALIAAKEFSPDLITMDLAMPGMDGQTTIARLRADPEMPRIPIIVVSAIQGRETAGGDMTMGKPIDETRFLDNIHLLLGGGEPRDARSVQFLIVHEADKSPLVTPSIFKTRSAPTFCPVENLASRVSDGFKGMVVIPTELIDRVDLKLLQSAPSLELILMPDRVAETKSVN